MILSNATSEPMPREIHEHHCKHCPSVVSPDAPDLVEVRDAWPRRAQIESAFRCAWRRQKLCRGYCDALNISDRDLKGAV